MIQELIKYYSETKWFGQDIYNIGHAILHLSCPTPEGVEHKESVGIVLNPQMTEPWKAAGEQLKKAVSSRIVVS